MVGLGVGPPCLRVDSEETLLTVIDERAQLARAAPGVTPVDSSEEGAPVPELIKLSVLGEPLVDSLQEPMPAVERLEYAIQATDLIWEPLEQVRHVVSDDVDFDYFGMAPWDAGGIHGDICQSRETFWTMMLQWLMRLLCRQAIINGLNGTMRMNTEYGLDQSLMTNTDSPQLAVTPGEWYASETMRMITTDLRQMNGITRIIGAMGDCWTVGGCPQLDSAVADCGVVELIDLIVRRTSLPPDELSARCDRIYTIDCNTVWGFPHIDSAVADCGAVDLIFRRTSFPPDDLSARRNGDYIWWDLWTGPSVCNRSVTGSLTFGSSQRLGRCCLWLAALPFRWIGSAEFPLCNHLLPAVCRSTSHEMEAPFHSPLSRYSVGPAGGNVFAEWSKYDLDSLDSPRCRHPVWPDGGSVFAELDISLYDPCLCVCRQLLAFNPAVHRTTSGEGEMYSLLPYFRLILTFSYCLYKFLREQELGTGRSPDTDKVDSFKGQIRWARLNDFEPDIPDAMEVWALRPHTILVKVISICRVHVFFHQYLADLREERLENVLRTVSASPFIFDMTVSSTSGVITTPPEGLPREVLPLTTEVNILYGVNTGTPFVVPPALDIERPVMQLLDFLTYRTSELRQYSLLLSLSASASVLTLPRSRQSFRRLHFLSTVPSLYEERHRLRRRRPGCLRRQMTVWLWVWMIQTQPCSVSRFRGQNTLFLCLHVRRSGLCCQPDPPVFPTGSVFGISTTLPEG